MYRVGNGFDVHQLVIGRKLRIGGVEIPYEKGLLGHSDADVLVHAIMDALLGAAGLGDIGQYFPDNKIEYKNIDSLILLKKVREIIKEFNIVNIDSVIIAQEPKMQPYFSDMKENIARVLRVNYTQINMKATTTETMGFTGRKEGIAVLATALLKEKKINVESL
ncbi:MAG: 2-C-methyl-D-erythritol 2,4-cyclodiphosphate synthase [Candidatus Margulisbacteria bacterium]|nr:2-C-methyl-D-erythritol 2,4-cyclodiphosphate synthase [Candidatus Margulisiibacteriota bacterium]